MTVKKNNSSSTSIMLEDKLGDKPKQPGMYAVYLLNDDYTPMDFVVEVLEHFFTMSSEAAVHTMLQVHHHGRGLCGFYTKDIAETKVLQVNEYAKRNQHPLLCNMEEEMPC